MAETQDQYADRLIRKAMDMWRDREFIAWAERWLNGDDRTVDTALAMLEQMRYGRGGGLNEIFGLSTARAAVEYVIERAAISSDAADTGKAVDDWFRRSRPE